MGLPMIVLWHGTILRTSAIAHIHHETISSAHNAGSKRLAVAPRRYVGRTAFVMAIIAFVT